MAKTTSELFHETLESAGLMKILLVFALFLLTLKLILSTSHGKLCLVLIQATIYILSLTKM